jgi:hypothetical protein
MPVQRVAERREGQDASGVECDLDIEIKTLAGRTEIWHFAIKRKD